MNEETAKKLEVGDLICSHMGTLGQVKIIYKDKFFVIWYDGEVSHIKFNKADFVTKSKNHDPVCSANNSDLQCDCSATKKKTYHRIFDIAYFGKLAYRVDNPILKQRRK